MTIWLFSSRTVENIKIAKEHLCWGFWDRDCGEKFRKNWREFIRLFNRIRPFDVALFQIAQTGEIHALGIVKNTYYDDQTPIWTEGKKKVKFPWRVRFQVIIFSEKPIIRHYVDVERYVDGYGIGKVQVSEYQRVIGYLSKMLGKEGIEINLDVE